MYQIIFKDLILFNAFLILNFCDSVEKGFVHVQNTWIIKLVEKDVNKDKGFDTKKEFKENFN